MWYLYIPFFLHGLAYSIYSPIIFSIFKYEVDEKYIGTAFGIVFSLYNLIYIFYLYTYGAIVDKYEGKREGYVKA